MLTKAVVADITSPGRGIGWVRHPDGDIDFLITRGSVPGKAGTRWLVHESVTDDPFVDGVTAKEAVVNFAHAVGVHAGAGVLRWETKGDKEDHFDL